MSGDLWIDPSSGVGSQCDLYLVLRDRVEIFVGQHVLWDSEVAWIEEMVASLSPQNIFVVEEMGKWPMRFGERFFKELSPQAQLCGYQSFLRNTKQSWSSMEGRSEKRMSI